MHYHSPSTGMFLLLLLILSLILFTLLSSSYNVIGSGYISTSPFNNNNNISSSLATDLFGAGSSKDSRVASDSITIVTQNKTADTRSAIEEDKFGIQMIYPTKVGGEEWYLNMTDATNDPRFDPQGSIINNQDGSWKMQSQQVRMNVFTSTGYDKRKIVTTNHSELAEQGYIQSPNDWKNVEITGYVRANNVTKNDDNFSWYGRGGKHFDEDHCEGTAYKGNLFFSGGASVTKKAWHTIYDFSERVSVSDSMKDRWIGFKFIVYNYKPLDDHNANNNIFVKLEIWLDDNNDRKFEKVFEHIDSGGWGPAGISCGGKPNMIITWGGPIVIYRWDNAPDVDFRHLSVREIEVPTA